ncbi:MAG TPA: IS1634 family transposase, partial [Gemmataceae bacterium]|nr:IS1634 family transposase [Gemmataceae bacterium]
DHTSLESLDVGAAPVVRHLLDRLQLASLLARHLPPASRRPEDIPASVTLCVLVTNLLLARRPLYGLAEWAADRVPEHLGLQPGQAGLLGDDRFGRALDRLYRADRASLLTALVVRAVREFQVELRQTHHDTTTVTFAGAYHNQAPAEERDRPPRITFGYNKDHRPDLKQLLFSITVSADGAVPVHCKTYDGNVTDDQVHVETWDFLCQLVGHANFLYVADCKLCTRDNMSHIAGRGGRFLTVLPRTRAEDGWFRSHLQEQPPTWREVRREPNPRRQGGPDVVYDGVESPRRTTEGYRVLWYRSSQKRDEDCAQRQARMERARAWLEGLQVPGRRPFRAYAQALQAGQEVLRREGAERWLRVRVEAEVEETFRQVGPGRPGPDTEYRRVETRVYRVHFDEDGAAVAADALCDGLFPLVTNDEALGVQEALAKYKYQPFVEKRHEQLKSVFGVAPVWLKSPRRVAALLWLYFVVELVQALVEREVRRQMRAQGVRRLNLYPEGRASKAPTAGLVFGTLEGNRRHRLLDGQGQVLRTFHDGLPEAGGKVLELLGVDGAAYGLP